MRVTNVHTAEIILLFFVPIEEKKMRTFQEPNLSNNWQCPICKKNEKKEVVLIGIIGTESGNNIQAEQFHLDCIHLLYDKSLNLIYQRIKNENEI